MKYFLSLLLNTVFTLLLFSSILSAAISPNQLSLGGIYLGDSIDRVYSIYGKPRTITNNGPTTEYYYGNGLLITFWNESQPKDVIEIKVTERNGFATPAGIEVGMHEDILYQVYGKPDIRYARNVVHYQKYVNNENQSQYIIFAVSEEKIIEILLHWSA